MKVGPVCHRIYQVGVLQICYWHDYYGSGIIVIKQYFTLVQWSETTAKEYLKYASGT